MRIDERSKTSPVKYTNMGNKKKLEFPALHLCEVLSIGSDKNCKGSGSGFRFQPPGYPNGDKRDGSVSRDAVLPAGADLHKISGKFCRVFHCPKIFGQEARFGTGRSTSGRNRGGRLPTHLQGICVREDSTRMVTISWRMRQ
jgi:hypothetical protein